MLWANTTGGAAVAVGSPADAGEAVYPEVNTLAAGCGAFTADWRDVTAEATDAGSGAAGADAAASAVAVLATMDGVTAAFAAGEAALGSELPPHPVASAAVVAATRLNETAAFKVSSFGREQVTHSAWQLEHLAE
jgi:hypothetical protein